MIAYITGYLPDSKLYYKRTKCLVTIEISKEHTSIFDRHVTDKNYATYEITNFKIIEIIDELKQNYTKCHITYANILYDLNDVVNKNTTCYLTKKCALFSIKQKIDNCINSYNKDGLLIKKIYYFNNKSSSDYYVDTYNENGLAEQKIYKNHLESLHKKWSENGKLILHKIIEKNVWIDILDQEYQKENEKENENKYNKILNDINNEIQTNAKIYNKTNEKIFIDNMEHLLSSMKNTNDITYNLKINELFFNYFNSVCGKQILKSNTEIRTIVLKKIKELEHNDKISNSIQNIKSTIYDLICQEYENEQLESWSENNTIDKICEKEICKKIKILLEQIQMYKEKTLKIKISTILYRYLNSPFGKIFLTNNEKFRNVVISKIKELKDDVTVVELLTSDDKQTKLLMTQFINSLELVNEHIINMK